LKYKVDPTEIGLIEKTAKQTNTLPYILNMMGFTSQFAFCKKISIQQIRYKTIKNAQHEKRRLRG
jgi:hypothetical protein